MKGVCVSDGGKKGVFGIKMRGEERRGEERRGVRYGGSRYGGTLSCELPVIEGVCVYGGGMSHCVVCRMSSRSTIQ